MPGVSGLGLCKEIRQRDRKTPIIIFSGHAFAADREAGRLAGANVYLVKPDSGEIVPTVKRLLEQSRVANSELFSPSDRTTTELLGKLLNCWARGHR